MHKDAIHTRVQLCLCLFGGMYVKLIWWSESEWEQSRIEIESSNQDKAANCPTFNDDIYTEYTPRLFFYFIDFGFCEHATSSEAAEII